MNSRQRLSAKVGLPEPCFAVWLLAFSDLPFFFSENYLWVLVTKISRQRDIGLICGVGRLGSSFALARQGIVLSDWSRNGNLYSKGQILIRKPSSIVAWVAGNLIGSVL